MEQLHTCGLWKQPAKGCRGEEIWLCVVPKLRVGLGLAQVIPSEENQFQQLHLKSGKTKAVAKGQDLCALSLLPKTWTNFILKESFSSSKLL